MKELLNMNLLADLLCDNPGTRIQPKGDGRVEIPRSITFLMGWNRRKYVNVFWQPGSIYLTVGKDPGREQAKLIGRIAVSMDRVRVPMSYLRTADLGNLPVVASPEVGTLESGVVVVRQDLRPFRKKLGNMTIASAVRSQIEKEKAPWKDSPALFPSKSHPTVVRILGKPFMFYGVWTTKNGSKGSLRLAGVEDAASASSMFAVPVLRRKGKEWSPAWLMASPALYAAMGSAIKNRQAKPEDYDLIIWYQPASRLWFSVFSNPVEPLDEDLVRKGVEDCGDPRAAVKRLVPALAKSEVALQLPIALTSEICE